ncbi:hypothetical protein [Streptomyces rochei]|uniref:hypothetical protein n=1 Tax=Streptomyces rochei TaxID=1928 RepID=UPI0033ADA16F
MSDPSNAPEPESLEGGSAQPAGSDLLTALVRRNRMRIDDSEQWVYAINGQDGLQLSSD